MITKKHIDFIQSFHPGWQTRSMTDTNSALSPVQLTKHPEFWILTATWRQSSVSDWPLPTAAANFGSRGQASPYWQSQNLFLSRISVQVLPLKCIWSLTVLTVPAFVVKSTWVMHSQSRHRLLWGSPSWQDQNSLLPSGFDRALLFRVSLFCPRVGRWHQRPALPLWPSLGVMWHDDTGIIRGQSLTTVQQKRQRKTTKLLMSLASQSNECNSDFNHINEAKRFEDKRFNSEAIDNPIMSLL